MARQSRLWRAPALDATDDVIRTVRAAEDMASLWSIARDFSDEIRCRHFAIITHEDLRVPGRGSVDLRDYADGAVQRIIGDCSFRRDPVMRRCIFADSAFLWSEMHNIAAFDDQDRIALELGRREGLNEGITVPCGKLGYCLGSCTFAGFKSPRMAELALGPAQLFGIFAFQRARRLTGPREPAPPLRLAARYRDCVMFAGRGMRNKSIAHRLGLTEDTVESYLRDARRLFGARDRTELVAAALLAGEIGLEELRHT